MRTPPEDQHPRHPQQGSEQTRGAPAGDLEPVGYAQLLETLKERVRITQVRAARAANTELLRLYYSIGRDILERQDHAGWGGKVIDRLAADLRDAFPDLRGFSVRNLHYMRAVAAAWPEESDFLQSPSAELTWSHVTTLITQLDDQQLRTWYATHAVQQHWSRNVLQHQIMSRLHTRIGAAPSNFAVTLPPPDSDLAQALTRDPYVFDHLALTGPVSEKRLEQALMDKLQATLTAFGHGMAFVGRQVRFTLGNGAESEELIVDLLLFHLTQLRYVVVELKVTPFQAGMVGQLGTYVAMVDDLVRDNTIHAPTIGILLVAGRSEQIVRYALSSTATPLAVADYTYETLPPEARAALPDSAQLQALLDETVQQITEADGLIDDETHDQTNDLEDS
ncbi:PDDEXK nuclease domain-containing protein [Kineococcus sp. NBC_00420]|uniref:PDDEXK nuclease domain-containing protein n=1 Tax=Kineococcus sp. NBC_00420 TaxID=2903564 RepID=UPI002E1B0FF8